MTARTRVIVVALLLAMGGLVLGHLWLGTGLGPLPVTLAVGAALGEYLRLPRLSGRSVGLSLAVVGAGVLMGASPAALAVYATIAWVVQTVALVRDGHQLRLADLAMRLAGVVFLGLLAAAVSGGGVATELRVPSPAAVAVVWVGLLVVVPLLDDLEYRVATGHRRSRSLAHVVHDNLEIGIATAGIATLSAIVVVELGWLTLPLLGLPLTAARPGLERYEIMRRSTAQTLRAMSRLPEQMAAVPQGHGVRTSHRARALALAMDLVGDEVEVIERAALLHSLGLLRRKDHPDSTREEVAMATRDIIREAGDFAREAAMVMASRGVAMPPDLQRHADPHLIIDGGAIVRAACLWDARGPMELVGDRELPKRVRDAVFEVASRAGVSGLAAATTSR